VCTFKCRSSAVHHEFSVFAGKYHKTKAPASITQNTATEQQLLVVEGKLLVPPTQHTLKLVEVIVWRLTCYFTCTAMTIGNQPTGKNVS